MTNEDKILSALFVGESIGSITKKLGLTVDEINKALSNTDLVVCFACETVSSITGLVGEHSNDCPVCGAQILKG